ncbi:MAG: beta-lactamase family protein [Gammaproteobacteria bacterium]|nr:beta-lactamase family protein [Gammaproteobacteria bacterium]MDH5241043.1 beta-lactamase family protein [Gammaproteobacteria bacterium]MDH5262128.1 beta-lactamase family protein [Gammaproteobacteria bacterium]
MAKETAINGGLRARRLALASTISLVCLLPGLVLASEWLSDDTFNQITIDVQVELDARYAAAQSANELFPGATFAFGLPDGRVAKFTVGYSDLEKKLPMRSDSRMPSGSIGKTYVAAVAMSMVEDGLLQLDGRIGTWLGDEPWFARLPNGDSITLLHLLNHSSGIIDHVFDTDSQFQDYLTQQFDSDNAAGSIDPRELVRFVLDKEPLFPAGEGFHYTDTGYLLVGIIIEKATGSGYYEELTRRLLVPLNLRQTTPLDHRDIAGIAQGYAPESQRLFGLPYEVVDEGALVFDPSLEWTGGGLVTTSEDLVRWAVALFSSKAIARPYVDEMLNSIAKPEHYADEPGRNFGYGLGINVAHTRLGVAYHHGGFFPGYNSLLAYFPDVDIAVGMQINTDQSNLEEHFDALVKVIMGHVSRETSAVDRSH